MCGIASSSPSGSAAFADAPATASASPAAACTAPDDSESFLTDIRPAPNSARIASRPAIFAHIRAGVDPDTVRILLDGNDITPAALRWPAGFVALPKLQPGCHVVLVTAAATTGNRLERRWAFASGPPVASETMTVYSGPQTGDAIAGGFSSNGNAPVPGALVVAVSGSTADGTVKTTAANGAALSANASETQTTADASTAFALDLSSHFGTTATGVFALVTIDPSNGAGAWYEAAGLRAAGRWCPEGTQHSTPGADAALKAFDAAQSDLCTGDYALATKIFVADLAPMRRDHRNDGHRWLDFLLDSYVALLATGSYDDAARFLRSIDANRQPVAADRLYFAGKYDAAVASYAALQKTMAAHSAYDTTGSLAGLLVGNAAARRGDWSDAFASWFGAAGTGHQVMEFDVFDDWNLDALQMMYYYRTHIPR